jgi:signal transduction histidine kinase
MCELRMKKANGAELWARLDATVAQDNVSGMPICRTTLSDITETRHLQNDLARADRMASMGVLAAGVAHEINNPLMYMLYNLESLSKDLPRVAEVIGKLREALRELVGSETLAEIAGENAKLVDPIALDGLTAHADYSVEGARRISMITKGLNSFSRADRKSLSRVDLNHAAERAVEMTANEVKCRAVMRKDLGPLPEIMASDVELSQVFVNLIINAAHAIDEGAAQDNRIAIRTWSDADHVLAEVTDTGCGIPGEHLDDIFEPFFTTKGPERGTGLGLAVTHRIVSNFGGDIYVESTVGKGTRFLIRFPIQRNEATQSPAIATEALGIHGRILVVDDEEHIREVLVSMLGREHDIVAVGSGQEAREILEADARFDLILCDLMMPNVSGIDLHEWIADRQPSLAKQLVFMSGGVFTPRTDAYLRRVDNVLMEKPFNRAHLTTLVGEKLVAAARHKA